MASEFNSVSILELAAKIPNATAAGPFGSNLVSRDYTESGVPVIRGQNLISRWIGGEFVFVSEAKATTLRTNTARPGDIVFTQRGTLGQVAVVPEGAFPVYVISQSQMKLTVDPAKVDGGYIYYACTSAPFISQIRDNTVAAGVPHINLGTLRNLTVPLPPMDEQQRISALLGRLDDRIDRIDLLRETNTTIESIAQTLFKSWFVDFDPVRAKAEDREQEAMDAATAALFPSEFEESELGLIPKGWRARTLTEFAALNASKWTARKHPATIKYIDLSGVSSNRIDGAIEYPFEDAPSRARNHLRDGDTIVGTVRPGNRAFAHVSGAEPNFTGSTGFAVLSPRSAHVSSFVYLAATRDESISRLTNLADGGAYPAVRPIVVAETPCFISSDEIVRAFSGLTKPMMDRIGKNREIAASLAELRDTLLPRLISGKLRLPEAESLIETTEMA